METQATRGKGELNRGIKIRLPGRPLTGDSSRRKRGKKSPNVIKTRRMQTRSTVKDKDFNNNATLLKGVQAEPEIKSRSRSSYVKSNELSSKRSRLNICDFNAGRDSSADVDDQVEAVDADTVRVRVRASEMAEFSGSDESDEEEGQIEDEGDESGAGMDSVDESGKEKVSGSGLDNLASSDACNQFIDNEISFRVCDLNVVEREIDDQQDTTDGGVSDFSEFSGNPAFEKYIKTMVAKELEIERRKSGTVRPPVEKRACLAKQREGSSPGEMQRNITATPQTAKVKRGGKGNELENQLVKSPSDTTIYAPALNRINGGMDGVVNSILMRGQNTTGSMDQDIQPVVINNILNTPSGEQGTTPVHVHDFIEGIRREGIQCLALHMVRLSDLKLVKAETWTVVQDRNLMSNWPRRRQTN